MIRLLYCLAKNPCSSAPMPNVPTPIVAAGRLDMRLPNQNETINVPSDYCQPARSPSEGVKGFYTVMGFVKNPLFCGIFQSYV